MLITGCYITSHSERRFTGQMDYIIWHQDLVTSAPVSDLEVFHIPDEGLFLAAAAVDLHEPTRKQQSTVFKWDKDHFTVYQSLYTLAAYCWKHFTIGKRVGNNNARLLTTDKPPIETVHVSK